MAKAVAELMKAVAQAMAAAKAERPQSMARPKLGGPSMRQTSFNWEADDKYSGLKNFRLEVNNILATYNTPQAEHLAIVKMFRQERPAIQRIVHMQKKLDATHWRVYSQS